MDQVRDRSLRRSAWAALLWSVLGASCAEAPPAEQAHEPSAPAQQTTGPADGGTGLRFGRPSLRGPGCPPGSVESRPSDGGELYEFEFSKFKIEVDSAPSSPQVVQSECTLEVEIIAPNGIQYALTSFSTIAEVMLRDDVVGEVAVDYSLNNLPKGTRKVYAPGVNGAPMIGPFNEDYLEISDAVHVPEQVWSSCAARHVFQARMRLKLTNTTNPKRSGSLALSWADGELSSEVEVGIAQRPCQRAP